MTLPHKRPLLISGFGDTRGRKSPHTGIDTIPAGSGHWPGISRHQKDAQNNLRLATNIKSVLSGVCIWEGFISGAGYTVAVEVEINENKFVFLYAHLSEISVNVGDYLEEGAILGKMGFSGVDKDNVHLHLSVCQNPLCDVPKMFHDKSLIDPIIFFEMQWNGSEGRYELFSGHRRFELYI